MYDPDVLNGYGKRDYNWDFSTEVQHELRPGFGVTGGYYYNTGGYYPPGRQPPARHRQPGGDAGGLQHLLRQGAEQPEPAERRRLRRVRPGERRARDSYGKVQNFVTSREPYGNFESRNDFFNVAFDARLAHGIRLGGGVDTGRSIADNCFVVDSPQELVNCRVVTPFKAQTQLKAHGVFPIPLGFTGSFAYQNLSGPSYNASYTASNAEIIPSLGRPLSGGVTTATIPLVAPQTLFEDRISRIDLRLSHAFTIQKFRLQLNLDAYNALNSSSIRAVNSTYGPQWRLPLQILDPRIFQVGGQISF